MISISLRLQHTVGQLIFGLSITLSQFDPRLRVENIVARASAEDVCIERVYLAE